MTSQRQPVAWVAAFLVIASGLLVFTILTNPTLPKTMSLPVNNCIVMEKPISACAVLPTEDEDSILKIRPIGAFVMMCDIPAPATAHALVEYNPLKRVEASAWVVTVLSPEAHAKFRRTIDESFAKLPLVYIVFALLMLSLYKCWAPTKDSSPDTDAVALDEIESAKQTIAT
jgi:hypothetical protein